jgi:hypothetical protein
MAVRQALDCLQLLVLTRPEDCLSVGNGADMWMQKEDSPGDLSLTGCSETERVAQSLAKGPIAHPKSQHLLP